MVCFVRISSAGENGFVGLWFRTALVRDEKGDIALHVPNAVLVEEGEL